MVRSHALIAVVLGAACGDGARATSDASSARDDAPTDVEPDADLVNFDVTGSYIDWDASDAAPCPVVGSTWTVTYDHSRVATTDGAGNFTISLTSYYVELDIAPPTAPSNCAKPAGVYALAGHAIIPPALHFDSGHFVARAMSSSRLTSMFDAIGQPFDASAGQLVVHVDGPPRAVSIDSPHAAVQAFDGTTWAAGATGSDVLFPNIDLATTPRTTVAVVGGAIGTGSVALLANHIVYITVISQ